MPDPINAFVIFVNVLCTILNLYRGHFEFALLHGSIVLFVIYLHSWARSKAKSE